MADFETVEPSGLAEISALAAADQLAVVSGDEIKRADPDVPASRLTLVQEPPADNNYVTEVLNTTIAGASGNGEIDFTAHGVPSDAKAVLLWCNLTFVGDGNTNHSGEFRFAPDGITPTDTYFNIRQDPVGANAVVYDNNMVIVPLVDGVMDWSTGFSLNMTNIQVVLNLIGWFK